MGKKQNNAALTVEDVKNLKFEDMDGHELLRPLSTVKGSDQARAMNQLSKVRGSLQGLEAVDLENPEKALEAVDLDKVADLIDYVAEHFALDVEEFEKFTSGEGGMSRAFLLTLTYLSLMGE